MNGENRLFYKEKQYKYRNWKLTFSAKEGKCQENIQSKISIYDNLKSNMSVSDKNNSII